MFQLNGRLEGWSSFYNGGITFDLCLVDLVLERKPRLYNFSTHGIVDGLCCVESTKTYPTLSHMLVEEDISRL